MKHDLFLQALRGENQTGKIPLWLMRQAGRYMSSYQKLRKAYSFLDLCHTPKLIQQVTTLPIDEFGFDAAILFSDILILLEALGFTLDYENGPKVTPQLVTLGGVDRIDGAALRARLPFVFEGIELLRSSLDRPLIGFAAAPFTLSGYLLEGGAKKYMREDPLAFQAFLALLTDITVCYCQEQIAAGCDAIQIFESSAGEVTSAEFEQFCLPALQKIVRSVPVILFARNSIAVYESLAALGPQALSLDCGVDLAEVRKKTPITLQGNLDPHILLKDQATIEHAARRLLESMRGDGAYICNLGHGVLPTTPEKNVHIFVDAVRSFS